MGRLLSPMVVLESSDDLVVCSTKEVEDFGIEKQLSDVATKYHFDMRSAPSELITSEWQMSLPCSCNNLSCFFNVIESKCQLDFLTNSLADFIHRSVLEPLIGLHEYYTLIKIKSVCFPQKK